MEAKLTVIAGNTSKREIRLQLPAAIGRGAGCGLCIAHPMISRRHCELSEVEGLLMLRDLDSLNGTFLAGKRISEAALRPGDQFTIGPITFRAEYEYHGDLSAIPVPKLAPAATRAAAGTSAPSAGENGSVSATSAVSPAKASSGKTAHDDIVSFPLEDESPGNKANVSAAPKQPAGLGNDKHTPAAAQAKKPFKAAAETAAKSPAVAKPGPQKPTPQANRTRPAPTPTKSTPKPAPHAEEEDDSSAEPLDQAFEDFLKGVQ